MLNNCAIDSGMKSSRIIFLFCICAIIRFLFSITVGFDNNYSKLGDPKWLIEFADKATQGDFNFDIGRFIASPLFPTVAAGFKIIFGDSWSTALVIFQILFSALSCIYIYRITELLFSNTTISLMAGLIYSVFPMTMYYVNTFSQETLFQCLFIISIYYLIVSLKTKSFKAVIMSAVIFSLAFLTKAHVLLFALFIPLMYFIISRNRKYALQASVIYASLCFIFSLPYGIYHKIKNDTFIISSNGFGFQFYLGNTNAGYTFVTDVPELNSAEYKKVKDIIPWAGYWNGNMARYDSMLAMPASQKQLAFIRDAKQWIAANPLKFVKLKSYDLFFFLMPGVSFRNYSFRSWIAAFVVSFPIYLFAYIGTALCLRKKFKEHAWMLFIFISMMMLSVILYVQNRFRTITLEPFYIIYASYYAYFLFQKYFRREKKSVNGAMQ